MRSSWSPPFGDPFEAALGEGDDGERLDLGCAVLHGAFDVRHENGEREITTSEPEASLMFFLLHLFGLKGAKTQFHQLHQSDSPGWSLHRSLLRTDSAIMAGLLQQPVELRSSVRS